ncbi:MAG: phosphotransferase [Chloroflexi bacterium]|nr:phosphotransferase [Chloroflexota bacterium]
MPLQPPVSPRLKYYLDAWALSDPLPLAETVTSQVYSVLCDGTRVVLKLLTPIGIEDEQTGAVALRYFNGQGAVHLLRHDGQAHLLEYAEGENLTALVERGEDEQATIIIAGILNQLHAVSADVPSIGLTPLRVRFASLFRKAETDRTNGTNSVFVRAARVAEDLLAHPRDVRVLHGDIHHYNIRYSDRRGWLAYDPKGCLIGERTYDAANTLSNPDGVPELVRNEARLLKHAGILAEAMGCDVSRLLAFFYAYVCLNASWYIDSGPYPHHDLTMAALVEPHVLR